MSVTPIEMNGVDNVQLVTNVPPVASISGAVLSLDFRVTVAQPLSADPAGPVEGQYWENTATHRAKIYDGAVTRVFAYESDSLSVFAVPTANLDIGTFKLINVVDPSSPQDAATKNYVDSHTLINPMTTLGDIIYGTTLGVATRLAGNTTAGFKVLASVGSGGVATAPTWSTIPTFGSAVDGIVPASGGGTVNFLRADGTWTTPGGAGTVTSVGLVLPAEFTVSGSPVTASGSLTAVWASELANKVLAAPNGAPGVPSFRLLVAADIPNIAESQVTNLTTDLAAKVPSTRQIINGTGITGGGDLSADRTLSVVANTTNQKVVIDKGGVLVGTRKEINLIEGTNVTMTVADNAGADRVDVTINSSGGGGGGSVRTTAAVTTASLAPNTSESDTMTMAKSFELLGVDVGGKKCRVRLYSTAADRTADASRPYTIPLALGSQHGCIADFYFNQVGAVDPWVCSPAIIGFNSDGPVSTNIYANITNMDTVSQAITVTLTYVPMES